MSINENKLINVLNHNENPVVIKTHIREYLCPKKEDGTPSITPLLFSEIESLNSNSNTFKIGTLRFPEEIEEEIYEAIRIPDWKEILKNEDIENIILNPTIEGLNKLIAIKNVALFERVRGVFFSLKNTGHYDVSTRVEKIINVRYKELCNRKIKTDIVLSPKDTKNNINVEEVNELKAQNEAMQAQMEQMKQMMEQMIKNQEKVEHKISDEEIVAEEPKKKSTSKKSTKKTTE